VIGDRLEAADVALNNNGKATTTHGEAQDGCCVARTLSTEPLAHVAPSFPSDSCWGKND